MYPHSEYQMFLPLIINVIPISQTHQPKQFKSNKNQSALNTFKLCRPHPLNTSIFKKFQYTMKELSKKKSKNLFITKELSKKKLKNPFTMKE